MSVVKDKVKASLGSRAVDADFTLSGVQRYMCPGGKSLTTTVFEVMLESNSDCDNNTGHATGAKILGRSLVIYLESQSHPY